MTAPPCPPAGKAKCDADETTADHLLNGRVALRQSKDGHRAGTDAVLLAATVPAAAAGLVADVGSGSGAVGICIGVRAERARLALVENEPAAAALARRNLLLNGLGERGRVFEVDVLLPKARRGAGLADGCADVVLTNPPYFEAGTVRATGDAARAYAHVMPSSAAGAGAPLAEWIRASAALLAPGGRFAMIHRPAKLAAILAALKGRVGSLRVTPVHPFASAEASRMIVEGTKGSRGATVLAPMLVLHEPGGAFTARAAAIHRGEGGL